MCDSLGKDQQCKNVKKNLGMRGAVWLVLWIVVFFGGEDGRRVFTLACQNFFMGLNTI